MPELPEVDAFELELLSTDFLSDDGISRLEQKLGLAGGGSWWLDLTQSPVEVDASGKIDTGAIVDVEAEAHAWLRSSFDKNPEFREHNYHLLGRLNELARLKGLVEEVAIKNHPQSNLSPAERSENTLFHSTLSLAFPGDLDVLDSDGYPVSKQLSDVRRSMEGPIRPHQTYGTYSKKRPKASNGNTPGLEQSHLDPWTNAAGLPNTGELHTRNVFNRGPQAITSTSSLRPKKSELPPSPHYNQLAPTPGGYTKRPPSRNSNRTRHVLAPPEATSSPDRLDNGHGSTGVLNRTYSKEALDLLKEQDFAPRRSSGSINGSLLQHFATHRGSGPLSEADSDGDISRSMENYGLGALSNSLTEPQFTSLRGSRVHPNTSYSSIRSTDILELARQQESKLRQHSGSRGKLNGSNSSLTGSLIGEDGLRRSKNRSQSSLGSSEVLRGSYDASFNRSFSPKPASNALDPSKSVDLTNRSLEVDSRTRDFVLDVIETSRRPEALSLNAELQNKPSELTTPIVQPTTDNYPLPPPTNTGPLTVTYENKDPGVFFPSHIEEVIPREHTTSPTPRLNSQTSFEQLEARISQETYLLDSRSSVDTQLTESLTSLEGLRNQGLPEVTSSASSSVQRSLNAQSKGPSFSGRPPSGLRPPSRLPAPTTRSALPVSTTLPPTRRLPAPSLHPPTVSSRSRPGSNSSSTRSSASSLTSRQPMSQLQNLGAKASLPGATRRTESSIMKGSSIRPPRPTTSTRPQVARSDASPVRSTSRRQYSATQNARRGKP